MTLTNWVCPYCTDELCSHRAAQPCPSDLTDEQWDLLEPVFDAPSKHADDLRSVVDAMLYIAQTGCQWRYLPESFGPWTRVWSQLRRWSQRHPGAGPKGVARSRAPTRREGGGDALHGRQRSQLVENPEVGTFVHDDSDGEVDGFAIITTVPAQPVYDPGGLSSLIDDFVVSSPDTW